MMQDMTCRFVCFFCSLVAVWNRCRCHDARYDLSLCVLFFLVALWKICASLSHIFSHHFEDQDSKVNSAVSHPASNNIMAS